jgi:hypothetical protein
LAYEKKLLLKIIVFKVQIPKNDQKMPFGDLVMGLGSSPPIING